ncbi:hypothetical protein D3C72_1392230 [compost metagenome]
MAHLQAEVVDHVGGAQPRRIAGAEIAIHVRQGQAGIGQRAARGFRVQLRHRLVRGLAGRVLVGPDDICLAFDAHGSLVLLGIDIG